MTGYSRRLAGSDRRLRRGGPTLGPENPRRSFRGIARLIASLALASLASAASTVEEKENPGEFSRVRGLFDVDLPSTVAKRQPKVLFHPHFGDLLRRDYLRVPIGLRLGLTESTEISPELESYFTHGLGQRSAGYGLDQIRFGLKHQLARPEGAPIATSLGFNASCPVGHPPLLLTDGFAHFSPYTTWSRPWPNQPQLTTFLSVGADWLRATTVRGTFSRNQPHSASLGGSSGFFFDRGIFKYTLVASYWTTALIGSGARSFTSVAPSILWQLPPALKFHAKGKWLLGLGLRSNFGPDGTVFGVSVKLRGEFKLSQIFKGPNQSTEMEKTASTQSLKP